ncbi:MAG: hypothetical protein AAF546_15065, partial [Verrucomicrobiota bacterium]
RADNIRKYTQGRFDVSASLAKEPVEFEPFSHPPLQTISGLAPIPTDRKLGLIVTDEDLSSQEWLREETSFQAKVGFFPIESYRSQNISESVIEFRRKALLHHVGGEVLENTEELAEWLTQEELDNVALAEPTTGLWDTVRPEVEAVVKEHSTSLYYARHWWDEMFFPRATRGFFNFKKAIPKALEKLRCTDLLPVN